ncbi:invasin, partial [Atlantibacter hermannii]
MIKRHQSAYLPGKNILAKWIIWLNILIQFIFPLTSAFSPAIAYAQQKKAVSVEENTQRTTIYRLSNGESVQSVAKKYNMTVEALRKLNQFRTFAHGFSSIGAGDEIDVPLLSSSRKQPALAKPSSGNASPSDAQEQKIAGYATQAGSFLGNDPHGDSARALALGMATGEASSTAQQWLSRFGTARVQLGADENFSLKNSQFDLLIPLWEQKDKLFFTQGSIHRTDDRTQSNLGVGLRYFADDYMVGGNTFFDHDLSRNHSRWGLGLEYGRDYLKLGANGYQRLTGWKDSKDFDDYEERPANGWDIRAEAWLPALPQLGGKITYEQYYGDEVALFSKDERQRDPHAVTIGVNYTPVPLLTMNAEQSQGSAGENETRVGLQMNYQLGVPWQHQVDPDNVAAMRSLNGSRYDLVERNNNIILEYRKKEIIRLHTVGLITGFGGEQKSLGVSVTSSHGLKSIDWSAPALLAAGGSVVNTSGSDYSVILPPYQYGEGAMNTYFITGVAIDKKGNHSDPSETQVTVSPSEISNIESTFKPVQAGSAQSNDAWLPADSKSIAIVELTLKDGQKQLVDVPVADISLAVTHKDNNTLLAADRTTPPVEATVSTFSRKSPGVYDVTVTAGTKNEIVTLTPTVRNITLSSSRVFIVKATPDAGQSSFSANPKVIAADNTATSTLTLAIKDASGNALTGNADKLSLYVASSNGSIPAPGKITVSNFTETATPGIYTATLKGILADAYKVQPLFSGSAIGTLNDTVTLTGGTTPDATQSTFTASPDTIEADNTQTSILTLVAKDTNGNMITGIANALIFSVTDIQGIPPAAGSVLVSNITEASTPGTYVATLKGAHAGAYFITPQYSGNGIGNLNATVTLKAGLIPDAGQSTFSASPKTLTADNTATSTLTLIAKDSGGNIIAGIASSLSIKVTDSHGAALTTGDATVSGVVETATPGTYIATLKARVADTLTVVPQFNGNALGSLSDSVIFTAGTTPDGAQSTFGASPKSIAADNTAISTLTFTAKDADGNAISGIATSLVFAVKNSSNATPTDGKVTVSSIAETGNTGVYTATLKG